MSARAVAVTDEQQIVVARVLAEPEPCLVEPPGALRVVDMKVQVVEIHHRESTPGMSYSLHKDVPIGRNEHAPLGRRGASILRSGWP